MTTRKRRHEAPSAIGAGLVALDLVLSADDWVAPHWYAGGTCANVMTILSFLGWDTFPISRLIDDSAAQYLRRDLSRWGVHDDFLSVDAGTDTPIIIQQVSRKKGRTTHSFSWRCPDCGRYLPSFRAPTMRAIEAKGDRLAGHSVYFFDRATPGTVLLAEKCAQAGTLVFFEPNGSTSDRLLRRALSAAHVVKYSGARIGKLPRSGGVLLEIKTLGSRGLSFRRGGSTTWTRLPVVEAPQLKDTCGAGDWCSAGILQSLGANSLRRLASMNDETLTDAIRFGQALAAWNCGFEGARGAMYHVESPAQAVRIASELLAGKARLLTKQAKVARNDPEQIRGCTSCFAPS